MAWRPLTVLERDSSTGIFLQILFSFKESFFNLLHEIFIIIIIIIIIIFFFLQINEVCSLKSICFMK